MASNNVGKIDASSAEASLRSMSSFDRAVAIIKHYETLHINKGRYIGYGHQIKPGEPYRPNQRLTPSQADALLRKDLHHFCSLFRAYGQDSLLLATLSYNVGPYRLLGTKNHQHSQLLTALRTYRTNPTPTNLATLRNHYLSFSRYRGHPHRLLHLRRTLEFELLFDP
ncbi:MAG: lysozyme [Bacteroidales bacterium]|nr:lysozyme [Bacteroidales bacterium]